MSEGDAYLRSKRRRRREPVPDAEAEVEPKPLPLVSQGGRSAGGPPSRPMTLDRLLRTLRESRFGGGWFRIE
jgi:hypothetical protein